MTWDCDPLMFRWGAFKAWGTPMHEANQSSSPEPQLARWHSRGPSLPPHAPSNNLNQGRSPSWALGKGQRLLHVQQLQIEVLDGHCCQQQVATKQTPLCVLGLKCSKGTQVHACSVVSDPLQRHVLLCHGTCQAPSVHWMSQARILECVAISSSRGSSRPRDQTQVSYVSCIVRWVHYH